MSIDKSVMPGLSTLPSLLSSRHHLLVLLLLLGGWIFSKGATTRNGLGHLREATCYVLVSDGTLSCFKGARRQIVFDTDVRTLTRFSLLSPTTGRIPTLLFPKIDISQQQQHQSREKSATAANTAEM